MPAAAGAGASTFASLSSASEGLGRKESTEAGHTAPRLPQRRGGTARSPGQNGPSVPAELRGVRQRTEQAAASRSRTPKGRHCQTPGESPRFWGVTFTGSGCDGD